MGTTSRDASCAGISDQAAEARSNWAEADHARAGEDVPTQTDAIAILDLAPLLLQGFVVHGCGRLGRWRVCLDGENCPCQVGGAMKEVKK
jgi:hypothetical protein